MDTGEQYTCFIKEHFRPLKIKDCSGYRIGRRTLDWVLEQERRTRLSHLTLDELRDLAARRGLKLVPFDDGCTYVVNADMERVVMVAFYQARDERDEAAPGLDARVPVTEAELLESYRISEAAVQAVTGDSVQDLELDPDSAVDFISCEVLEQAMDSGQARIFVDDGFFTVITADEEIPEGEVYALHIQRPLPGTEISIGKLDLNRRTYITGAYRDRVERSSHDFEHHITRMDDR